MKNAINFTRSVVVALVAVVSVAGCSKNSDSGNQVAVTPPATTYYGNAYCNTANCYGQAGYGHMFMSALGRINTTDLQAEIAMNFSTSTAVNNFTGPSAYSGNTLMTGTMNVYSSTYTSSMYGNMGYGGCRLPPGQYQLSGSGNFGYGSSVLSFTGTVSIVGLGQGEILFNNNFLTATPVKSVVGPSFPFTMNNDLYINVLGCGWFVMY